MLRITASKSAAGALEYFKEGLSRGDYYSAGETTLGRWGGLAAQRLGLQGVVEQESFAALINNQKPDGSRLNPRHGRNRKAGYDFTFSVPKSVSVAYGVGGDHRIQQAFEDSVSETMRQIESEMRTQKGQGKQKHYPETGNMVWASFTHKTSRPVDGVADPHLHRHVYVFNTTWHEEMQRFQAGEFGIIKTKAPYFEAAFNARLAMKLKALGYGIEKKGYAFELTGMPSSLLKKFSRRTEEIEKLAAVEEARQGYLSAKMKEKLGALSRAKKIPGQSWEGLQSHWRTSVKSEELQKVEKAAYGNLQGREDAPVTAAEAVNRSLDHLLERKSVTKAYQVKAGALKRAYGDILPEQVETALRDCELLSGERNYLTLVTTQEALAEENRMLAFVRDGKGKCSPLNANYVPQADFLNEEQRQAISHALEDVNRVTIISGGAGVGKTTLVKEVRNGIEQAGVNFFGFAPSAAASRGVLRKEGFNEANTLARLFVDKELQQRMQGAVIWVDEAGLIGNRDMNQLFEIAKKQNARILLTGDVKQHASVAAGDALSILEREGKIPVVRVNKIQRQRHNPRFKQVVKLTSEGKIDRALLQLDRMGGVVELQDKTKREQALVHRYIQSVRERKSLLVVIPTHKEGQQMTAALRQQLQEEGLLDSEERVFTRLKNTNWTKEAKQDKRHYFDPEEDLLVEFHQNAVGGHKKGDRWRIQLQEQNGVEVLEAEKRGMHVSAPLSLTVSDRFTVYEQKRLRLAKGDKIRVTKGGKTREGSRVNNGDVFRVNGFTSEGHIRLHTGKTLDKDFGHLTYGYVSTSHSAQGKTVDRVLIAQSAQSQAAASSEQFYVSISRARESARIFTDDKKALEQAVLRTGQRMTAREIAYWQGKQQQRKGTMKGKANLPSIKNPKQQHGKDLTL
ncbi:MAG: conjugative relaxase [Bacteroidetes bacterium]|nr:MAG: conjugative relaxase [Bacteroidota bacterium]